MHRSGSLPLTVEGPEQGSGGKNCKHGSRGKPWPALFPSPNGARERDNVLTNDC